MLLVPYYNVKYSSDPEIFFSAYKITVNLFGHNCLVLGPDHNCGLMNMCLMKYTLMLSAQFEASRWLFSQSSAHRGIIKANTIT